jgi:hypothetical protein
LKSDGKPATAAPKSCPVCAKLKALGTHLGRALDVAASLFSDNEAEFLARNKTALLSGNSANLLSGNKPNILSGNAPKLLSDNQTPILSGNSFSFLSNIKIEIHIENSGNGNSPAPHQQTPTLAPGYHLLPPSSGTTPSYPVPTPATR